MGKKSKELGGDVRQMIIESYRSNKNISELSRIFGIPRRTVGSVIGLQRYIEHSSICGTTADEPAYRIATCFYTRFANLLRKDFMKKTLLFFKKTDMF